LAESAEQAGYAGGKAPEPARKLCQEVSTLTRGGRCKISVELAEMLEDKCTEARKIYLESRQACRAVEVCERLGLAQNTAQKKSGEA